MFGCKTILSRLLGRLERVSVGHSNRVPDMPWEKWTRDSLKERI